MNNEGTLYTREEAEIINSTCGKTVIEEEYILKEEFIDRMFGAVKKSVINNSTKSVDEISDEYSKFYTKSYKSFNIASYKSGSFKIDSLLEKLYYIQSPSNHEENMRNFIIESIKKIDGIKYSTDSIGNLFVVKGNLKNGEYYPCVVAHMDTVFDIIKQEDLHIDKRISDSDKRLIGGYKGIDVFDNCGLGADDKNGVYIAIKMLNEKKVIKGAFFVGEERGCIGSSKASLDFFKDCGYLLQGDRRNGGDLIVKYGGGRTCSEEFSKKIAKVAKLFGYKEEEGLFTDVMILASRGINISVINYSVGYYNPHSPDEYTDLDELYNAKKFTYNIIDILGKNKYSHKYASTYSSYGLGSSHKSYGTSWKHSYDYGNFYEEDFDKQYDARNTYMDDYCSCSRLDKEYGMIDMNCGRCNPIVADYSDKYCYCGSELVEREFTMYCPSCNKHKLINIYANI